MSRDQWQQPEEEWEVAVDKKKINRTVRRERKEAEALAAGGAAVGAAPVEEFDAETRRRLAAVTFYGNPNAKGKKNKAGSKRREAQLDEEAGWTGSNYGEQKKSGKKGKAKAAVTFYDTAEELYEALAAIIADVPPTSVGQTTTLASLGAKLQTLTKAAWNKRYKSEFGTMKSFLEQRPDLFTVNGDEVGLAPAGGKRSKSSAAGANGAAAKQKSSKSSSSRSGAGGKQSAQTDEDSEEEGSEEDDDEETTVTRKGKKSGSSCSCGKVFGLLVAAGAAVAYFYAQQLKQ